MSATATGSKATTGRSVETTESSWRDILAGGISGGLTRLLIAPLDVIKIRFQVQTIPHLKDVAPATRYHYTSVADSVRTILREEGVLVRVL